jgi:hypothetical protein
VRLALHPGPNARPTLHSFGARHTLNRAGKRAVQKSENLLHAVSHMTVARGALEQGGVSKQATSVTIRKRVWLVPLMLIGISVYLYLNLFVVPNVPILLSGDQVFFWMNGQRMLYGEHPYQDFFQFTPPGADVIYFAIFKLFGPRIWSLNFTVLALGVALCWVCFMIASQIMERELAILSTLFFLTIIYTRLLNATHHYFSVLAVMGATAVLIRGTSFFRVAAAGALCGIASFFTQTHGAMGIVALTCWLVWQKQADESWRTFWKKEGALLSCYLLMVFALSLPFLARVGLKQLWFFQVTYVRKVMVHYPETRFLGMPEYSWRTHSLLSLAAEYGRHIFVYAMLPIVYLVVIIRYWKQRALANLCKVGLLALVGAALLGELGLSLNWLRLYAVSMPGTILFVWVIGNSAKLRRRGMVALWWVVICLGLLQPWLAQHGKYTIRSLPAGTTAIEPNDLEILSWGIEHTNPGDFLFEANWPGIYIPLGLRDPVFLDTAATTLDPSWAKQAVQQLDAKQVKYIVWAPRFELPADPHWPRTFNLLPLREYLHTHYQLSRILSNGEQVWERR